MKFLPEFQLVIVGKDKKLNILKKIVSRHRLDKRIVIAGPQHEVKPYLQAADIFCLPSSYDSFPNAVLEALCTALPVIVTNAVGIADAILSHQAGAVCDKTPKSIAHAIQEVWRNQDNISKNALLLSKNYDINIANQRWLDLYQRLISQKQLGKLPQ